MLPLLSHQSGHAPQQHQLQQQTEATQPPSALPTTQQQQTPTIRRSGSSIRNFLGCVGVGSSRHEAAQQPDQQQHRQASSVLRNRGRAGGVRSAPASESGSSSIGESGSGQGQASLKGLQQLVSVSLLVRSDTLSFLFVCCCWCSCVHISHCQSAYRRPSSCWASP